MSIGHLRRDQGKSKLYKMEPMIDHTNDSMLALIYAIYKWALDEYMLGLKNRMAAIQYLKGKLTQWGLKLFMGCLNGGFMFWCVPYSGADTMLGIERSGWGITFDSVIACVEASRPQMSGNLFD